ncbi:FadR/GntR family transcriptional regulator [Rhodoligotrophos ferricapiens]|uniref:FadR/GntR family transcriptional regulator n=1 Tax=Rhodoligotrophos ferricapiens TaxID=3069264 RepID=UPI00315DAB90
MVDRLDRSDVGEMPAFSLFTPALTRTDLLTQLRALLRQGRLRPGDRLPNERQIAEASGLSRSTVREVLGELEREGILSRHIGRGTYITQKASLRPPETGEDEPLSPGELMEFRALVEPSLVELIVLNATDKQLVHLVDCAAEGRNVTKWQEAEEADRRFHACLYELTNNRLFLQVGQRVVTMRGQSAWTKLKERSYSPERWSVYQQEHERIAQALSHRDAGAGRDLLRDHLLGVRNRARSAIGDL